jgi:type IV pilus assembly protein PilA
MCIALHNGLFVRLNGRNSKLVELKGFKVKASTLEDLMIREADILGYSSRRSSYLCSMPSVRSQHAIKVARSNLAGFSLVEILVVVMVILIIAAIAIPNLVHGKMRANEAAAVASIKTIQTAEVLYFNSYPEVGYSANLANLGTNGSSCEKPTSTNACLIMDEALTSGIKNGYVFEIVGDGNKPTSAYTVTASPESSVSGRCSVSSSESGELHFSTPDSNGSGGGDRSNGNSSGGGCGL